MTWTLADQRRWSYRLAVGWNLTAVVLNLGIAILDLLAPIWILAIVPLACASVSAVVVWWIVWKEARVRLCADDLACDVALRQHALDVMRTSGGEITIDQPIRH